MKTLAVKIEDDLKAEFKALAKAKGKTMSALLREMLAAEVEPEEAITQTEKHEPTMEERESIVFEDVDYIDGELQVNVMGAKASLCDIKEQTVSVLKEGTPLNTCPTSENILRNEQQFNYYMSIHEKDKEQFVKDFSPIKTDNVNRYHLSIYPDDVNIVAELTLATVGGAYDERIIDELFYSEEKGQFE